jgi:serine/threonine protein kinase
MVKGCSLLQEMGVAHRDIRASNIFYSSKQRRYLLGGFGCSRFIKQEDEEDLLTVYGIETQVEDKLR